MGVGFKKTPAENAFHQIQTRDLIDHLSEYKSVILAYSGGVDSTLLLYLLHKAALQKLIAVTSTSETYDARDLDIARKHTQGLGIEHIIVETCELEDPDFTANSYERCYFCKKVLFSKIWEIAGLNSINNIMDASNADDVLDYRPGSKAARELKVISPFKDFSWNKNVIRDVSKEMSISGWDRPATVCLASRIPYMTPISEDKLKKVQFGEDYLQGLGFEPVRVRSDGISARIEVKADDIDRIMKSPAREDIIDRFLAIGFKFVSVDLEGFKSGKMNRMVAGWTSKS
ncbi:ATP-dependent sacrificial sulfur transferase LarE [Elusimicrobiota bacterium]